MNCPHCGSVLTLKEGITILNGSGFSQVARVRLPDGRVALMEAALVNPNVVEVLDEAADAEIHRRRRA